MNDNSHMFPYEKAIVLNAIYDALDSLSFVIDKANSIRGTLFVSSADFPQMKGRIAISPSISGEQTLVEVITDTEGEKQDTWASALVDEVYSLIKRAGMEVTK